MHVNNSNTRKEKVDNLRKLTMLLLNSQTPVYSLRPELLKVSELIAGSQSIFRKLEKIDQGESMTSNGQAVSATMAAMCVEDVARTIQFIRGVHSAILFRRGHLPDRPVKVLYAGCGPYAPLAVPLMSILSPSEAVFTLLDIHQESTDSVSSIIKTLGFSEFILDIICTDAGSYAVDTGNPPDIIVMEIMRVCLESEPQVAVSRHLMKQVPNAILIPEDVSITMVLIDPSHEFSFNISESEKPGWYRDRIHIGTVFRLNKEGIESWSDITIGEIPASIVRMPDSWESRYEPMLATVIQVFKNHVLQDYDSGLTCPRQILVDGTISPDDTIRFHYQLGKDPRLIAEVIETKA